ncbi:MAG TPA: SpoIID/LytB domain-containing protein [Mycobacteriales bacterium]|nr:SpoIID/LytB domain-containing protein [Mycobacteriales bacterium]
MGIVAITLVAGAGAIMVGGHPPKAAAAAEVVARPASNTWIVDGHGYGHGRGMSQWGARAAAAGGRSAEQILAFYYPGTTRTRVGNPVIRVRVGTEPTVVLRPVGGMRVSWAGHSVLLPVVRGGLKWQIAPNGSTMRMRYRTAKAWVWWGPALPRQVAVTASRNVLRIIWPNGTSTDYREGLLATRSGSSVVAVNRLRLDTYLRGVVPRESPSSWPQQALRAQAVAARTYAYASIRSPRSALWNICDTTACQVYGGATRYSAGGHRLYGEQATTTRAVTSTAGIVLTRAGRVATTEYSASNGGWIAAGGTSYLPARRDPYRAGDPYARWSFTVNVVALGKKFGLARLDKLQVTGRDGQGEWGGRVTQVRLTGIDGAGKPRAVVATGSQLRSALGAKDRYLRLRAG